MKMALVMFGVFAVLPILLTLGALASPFGGDIRWWHTIILAVLSTATFFGLWDADNGFKMFIAVVANSLAVASLLVLCWLGLQLGSFLLDTLIVPVGVLLLFAGCLICPLIAAGKGLRTV